MSEILPIKSLVEQENEKGASNYLLKLIKKDKAVLGIATDFVDLDRKIIGLKPGEMFVLASFPSMGKSTFALNIANNLALNRENPIPVGIFSLDIPAEQLAIRMLCDECGYSIQDFINSNIQDITKFYDAIHRLKNAPVFVDATPELRIRQLRIKAFEMKETYGIQVIFIDYLQLMKAETPTENRQEAITVLSAGIKSMAKELNIPIVVLSQLNYEIEQRLCPPQISHLRESGGLEQNADVIAFLHRDLDKQMDNSIEAETEGLEAILAICKNRNGATGKIKLQFFPHRMRFFNKAKYVNDDDF